MFSIEFKIICKLIYVSKSETKLEPKMWWGSLGAFQRIIGNMINAPDMCPIVQQRPIRQSGK